MQDVLSNTGEIMIKNEDGSVTISEKEYERIVIRMAGAEYGGEEKVIEWANDDSNLSWEGDKWYIDPCPDNDEENTASNGHYVLGRSNPYGEIGLGVVIDVENNVMYGSNQPCQL